MVWRKSINLVVPVGGPYDISEQLENRKINSVTVEGIALLQNAKAGSKELINIGSIGIGTMDKMFRELSTDRPEVIGRSLVDKPILIKRGYEFACDGDRIDISANPDISTDPSKSFNLYCSIYTRQHPVIRIRSGEGYNAVIFRFDLGDVMETKKEDQADPVKYKNTVLIPIYFNHKEGNIQRIRHQDIITLLKGSGYEIADHKIAFVPDTRVVGILADKIRPIGDQFQYWSALSDKIESNEYLNPYESTDILIPTEGGVYGYYSNSMEIKKGAMCKFTYMLDGECHETGRYYSLTCNIRRYTDQVIMRSELDVDARLHAKGILLQVAFEGDPKIEKRAMVKTNVTWETSAPDLDKKVIIWKDKRTVKNGNNIAKDVGLKSGQIIDGQITITDVFIWSDTDIGDTVYYPNMRKLGTIHDNSNEAEYVLSKLNDPVPLEPSPDLPYNKRVFEKEFKLFRKINGNSDIIKANMRVELDIHTGDVTLSSSVPEIGGVILDVSAAEVRSSEGNCEAINFLKPNMMVVPIGVKKIPTPIEYSTTGSLYAVGLIVEGRKAMPGSYVYHSGTKEIVKVKETTIEEANLVVGIDKIKFEETETGDLTMQSTPSIEVPGKLLNRVCITSAIACTFMKYNSTIVFSAAVDKIVGIVLDTSDFKIMDLTEHRDDITHGVSGDNKPLTVIKEENVMGNKKELFGKFYGPLPSGVAAMDITGQLVMKPYDAPSYKRFDSKSGKIVDMLEHVVKLNNLAYVLPVNIEDVAPDDIVVVSNREFYVVKSINKANVIKGVNLADSTMLDIVPESLVGSDISFVAKVVNLLNPGKIDPMLMMMVMGNEEDDEMDTKTAMLMMMAMNGDGDNNMNMMLPMLLMDKDGEGSGMGMLLPMMMSNNQAGGNMNMMLPLMLMSDDGESDPKDMMLMMMMCNNMQQGDDKASTGIDMNMLMPMMMLDKGRDKKDLLLMMTILQKQANLERTIQLIGTANQKNGKKGKQGKQEKKAPEGDKDPGKEDE